MIRIILAIGGGLALAGAAQAETGDAIMQSYMSIVDRNAFALRPPPPPPPDPSTSAPPAQIVNVVFTAISNVNGNKKAYFKIPGDKPNVFTYPALREGEQEGSLKVLEGGIDEKTGVVRILNAGVPATLSFDANGNKDIGTTAKPAGPPGAPVAPGMMPPGIPRPAGAPLPTIPGATAIPTRTVRTQQPQPTPQENTASYVSSQLNIEIHRAANAQSIATGDYPPLPPTDFDTEH
jgi:hypothetical protein